MSTKIFDRLVHALKLIKSSHLFLILFICFLFPTFAWAQFTYELDKTTRFDKMGVKDGLSSEYTQHIHQDKFGFIWIGTQFGLNLYDGYEVKAFNTEPKNPQSIFNNYIHNIFEESDGTMWFGTSNGISKYKRANQTFSNYIPDTSDTHKAAIVYRRFCRMAIIYGLTYRMIYFDLKKNGGVHFLCQRHNKSLKRYL